ncbi:unnamed protein product [Adineta steineri]|uniref:Uncharacterized protein n=1 Tax=Adineta steineri TaxID=433720 RepID=A0A820LX66_9BILA|nr:unnamed protein product [Adineta steineri]
MLFMVIFTLTNDIKQIEYQDRHCILRAYIGYVTCPAYNYSFLLQSIYRYLTVVHPNRPFWQSIKFQILLLMSTWIFCFIYPFVSVKITMKSILNPKRNVATHVLPINIKKVV